MWRAWRATARWARAACAAALLLAAVGLGHGPAQVVQAAQPSAPLAGTLRVSSIADNTTSDGVLTLREALLIARGGTGFAGLARGMTAGEQSVANGCNFLMGGFILSGCGLGVADTIVFSPTLGANPVITITSPLPAITDTAATTVDGVSGLIFPTVSADFGGSLDMLTITSNGNQVNGVSFRNSPRDAILITGSFNGLAYAADVGPVVRYGIYIDGGDYNQIINLTIGDRLCPGGVGNGIGGVLMTNAAMSNTVGSNTIACNGLYGVSLEDDSAYNVVDGNLIQRHSVWGVVIAGGAHHNQVGSSAHLNTIGFNVSAGIELRDAGTSDNLIYNNRIGTDATGAIAEPNGFGIWIQQGAHHNQVGSPSANTGNLISGNAGSGVFIASGAHHNVVRENWIGLNLTGTAALPNSFSGVYVLAADYNQIGGSVTTTAQFISGNGTEGVRIDQATGTFVGGNNQIGVAAVGGGRVGNGTDGVRIMQSSETIVYALPIANNGGAGVALTGTGAWNIILPYAVRDNGGLPIDLGDDGHTPNDPGDGDSGPNDLLNYPVLTAKAGGNITGTTCGGCDVLIYRASRDPGAGGGGGELVAIVPADGAGNFTTGLPLGLQWWEISMVACTAGCDVGSVTSEMSPRPQLYVPLVVR